MWNANKKGVLANIRQFNGALKMQQAAMAFIQANIITNREKERLRKLFDAMDVNFDGQLSLEEVVAGLQKLGMAKGQARQEANRIFDIADIDKNGYLEFNEWCTATMNKRKMLKRPHLQAAFKMLDRDNSGTISYDEVRDVLVNSVRDVSSDAGNEEFKKMIQEMDLNGDRAISYTEFEQMMSLILAPGGRPKARKGFSP